MRGQSGERLQNPRTDLPLFRIGQNQIGRPVRQMKFPVQFRAAAGHHNERVRMRGTEPPHRLPALARRLGGHGTAVDHHQRGRTRRRRFDHPEIRPFQPGNQKRAVGGIQPAAQCEKNGIPIQDDEISSFVFSNDTADFDFLQSEQRIFLAQIPVPEYISKKTNA